MTEFDATPYWQSSQAMPAFPRLDKNLKVDVVVIGGGITGITAAYLLKQAGRTVALVERRTMGGVDTSHTTAHLTCVTDKDLVELVKNFGRDHARAVWDAGKAAINQMYANVKVETIDCEWSWVPGYQHAALGGSQEDERPRLQEIARLANDLGFDAEYLDTVPLVDRPGVRFEDQAKFHPLKYLSALVRRVPGDGSHAFEHTEADEVTSEPLSVNAGGHTIACGHVVVATHAPLMGKTNIASATLLQTKLYLYSSYAVRGRIPKGTAPEASWWDTSDPYYYLRIDRHADHDYAIFGGEDHKTGQASDTTACFRALETRFKGVFPHVEVTHRWSGQVIQTNDGLPYIGETSPGQFGATGYGGNGTTFGTLGAMMARDAVIGRRNPWQELFDVGRTKIKGGAWDYIKENIDYPYYMIRDRFAGAEGKSLRAVPRGQGRIIELDGKQVAVWRDDDGNVTRLSAICTHMGCRVGWNEAERTWDCPCHGSRFLPDGQVLAGPAEKPLEKV